jgi:hypothetical protein
MKVFPLCTKEIANRTEEDQKLAPIQWVIIPKLPPPIGDHGVAEYVGYNARFQPYGHKLRLRNGELNDSRRLDV